MPKPDLQICQEVERKPCLIATLVQKFRARMGLLSEPGIYQNFRKKRKDYFEFPVYKVQDVLDNYKGEEDEFDRLHNCIVEVVFSETPRFTDLDTALMCVVVLASDGQKGSFTHLTIPQTTEERACSVARFVSRLSGYWNKQVPVRLVGGEENCSEDYIQTLVKELRSAGFIVSEENNELGGKFIHRKATLLPDKVIVRRHTYSDDLKPVTLEFAKQ